MEHHPTRQVKIEIQKGSRENVEIIQINGPLTIHNFFDFQDAARQNTASLLIIDLAEVPYMDSAALGSLVGIHISREKANRKYALVNVNERILGLFGMSGLGSILITRPSAAEAEALLD